MSDSLGVRLHRRWVMSRRVQTLVNAAEKLLPAHILHVLDVGAGTGELAVALQCQRPSLSFTGLDVLVRPNTRIPVTAYDGRHLPLADNSVDAVMLMDVLHHCDDPRVVLYESMRVARHGVLIKDHAAENRWQRWVLACMDWVGNRAHHVALPNNYWSRQQWRDALDYCDLEVTAQVEQLDLYPAPLAWIFGGRLHVFWWLTPRIKEARDV